MHACACLDGRATAPARSRSMGFLTNTRRNVQKFSSLFPARGSMTRRKCWRSEACCNIQDVVVIRRCCGSQSRGPARGSATRRRCWRSEACWNIQDVVVIRRCCGSQSRGPARGSATRRKRWRSEACCDIQDVVVIRRGCGSRSRAPPNSETRLTISPGWRTPSRGRARTRCALRPSPSIETLLCPR